MAKLLSWSTADRSTSSFVAHGFPSSFQLNPADVRRGAIRVVAKAPSGQTFPMDVIENEGVYTTNFTPSEIGDWQISILFEGEHIQGSPFNVRVYDPGLVRVSGLTTGVAGQPFSFSVDTSGAGDGLLAVDIAHGSRNIPVRLLPDTLGHYRVNFTPETGGQYTIQVYFAGLEVTGSPFTMEVVDSVDVTVSGEGLGLVPINQQTSFLIHAPRLNTGMSGLQVTVTSPRGTKTSPRISDLRNGTYQVQYIPYEVGPYSIEIQCHSRPIIGSPFTAHGYDVSRVAVSGLRSSYTLSDVVQFDIDVSNAGDGNLEIRVNDGTIPCSVGNLGSRKYRATFTPWEAKQHSIHMNFNGRNVTGSPWNVDIEKPMKLSVSGTGLEHASVGKTAQLDINTAGLVGRITANIRGPTGRNVASHVQNLRSGVYRLEYTPLETGLHTVDIQSDGKPVPGSPFTSKVFSTAAVSVSPIPSGVIGSPVAFTVDVSRAGEGKLEIMVNRGSVPNSVRSMGPGIFEVSFIPRTAQPHVINITFNGQPLPGGPITVPVIDQSKITVSGNGIMQAAVNQKSTFHVNTQSAGNEKLSAKVIALMPGGVEIPCVIRGSAKKGYDVEFITRETGNYQVNVEYGGCAVQGSPFTVKSFDISKIKVLGVSDGAVGLPSSFTADVENAGEGDMEISITSSTGRNIPNKVESQGAKQFRVSYTPVESSLHKASITFNNQHITGSPFTFCVNDISKLTAKGSGLGIVPCNKTASFTVTGPGFQEKDLQISIKGPNDRPVLTQTYSTKSNSVTVDYTPTVTGDYEVDVKCYGHSIQGSPFLVHSWDLSKVFVSNIQPGRVMQQTKFDIDASQAGFGNLEIVVSVGSENTPNFVTAEGSGHFTVSFTPLKAESHTINIKFNGEPVPGSPFFHSVLDGRRAVASGDGLGLVLARRPTSFDVTTRDVGGDADLQVDIFDSNGEPVPNQVSLPVRSDFRVAYTPKTVGTYTVNVKYADIEISGSPFHPEVYDPSCVRVKDLTNGTIGKPTTFNIDATAAGEGHLSVKVKGQMTQPYVDVSAKAPGHYVATFEPREGGLHQVSVHFNDIEIPGSPFDCVILDADVISAKWDSARLCPASLPVQIELETKGALHGKITTKVTDPYGKLLNSRVYVRGSCNVVEYVPSEVGPHTVEVQYGSEDIRGSPFTSSIYDVSRVKLQDVPSTATIGQQVSFTVDTSEAGTGDVEVHVITGNTKVATRRDEISEFCQRFMFVPTLPSSHVISVAFNGENIIGSPTAVKVKNSLHQLNVVNRHLQDGPVVRSRASALIETHGSAVDPSDITVQITAPNGESVPSKLVERTDGNIEVEYTCKKTGRHLVEILYDNEAIRGTPFNVEAFDPNEIQIDGKSSWTLGEQAQIDVNQMNAGKADIGVVISGPRGSSVPFDVYSSSQGHRIIYTPKERGNYQLYITYGGQSVPGCPVVHSVMDSTPAVVSGPGLVKGTKDKVATFLVDPKGNRGDLVVQVDGPNSIAKCNIEPGSNGTYKVNYVPVEVGVYNVIIHWNGKPVEGSPFHPVIIDPSKVDVVGGWQSILNGNGCLPLTLHEHNSIAFITKLAGPGQLSAEVTCNDAIVPVDILQTNPDQCAIAFVPRAIGEYLIRIFWNGVQLPRSPIVGLATAPAMNRQRSATPVNPDKVILTGQGLHQAIVNQRTDFVIDGTEAGYGSPDVQLIGLNSDVNVQCVPLGGQKYQCSYVARVPGAYLLNITWANRPVRGSPFKVTVATSSNASRVTCAGDGLSSGVVGQELKTVIDTRRAGSGELSAQCVGPTKMAVCELVDHRDGTFALYVTPQEQGRHILEIKYGNDHIPGSPFVTKVSGSPDASKVTARGPGLQHGILTKYRSHFVVDTAGAGAGQLTVRVRGPKDAFHVEMQRDKQKDRTIICRYDPTEVGDYVVHIKWSGVHVPGSPFHVHIFDNEAELEKFKMDDYEAFNQHMTTPSPRQFDTVAYSE